MVTTDAANARRAVPQPSSLVGSSSSSISSNNRISSVATVAVSSKRLVASFALVAIVAAVWVFGNVQNTLQSTTDANRTPLVHVESKDIRRHNVETRQRTDQRREATIATTTSDTAYRQRGQGSAALETRSQSSLKDPVSTDQTTNASVAAAATATAMSVYTANATKTPTRNTGTTGSSTLDLNSNDAKSIDKKLAVAAAPMVAPVVLLVAAVPSAPMLEAKTATAPTMKSDTVSLSSTQPNATIVGNSSTSSSQDLGHLSSNSSIMQPFSNGTDRAATALSVSSYSRYIPLWPWEKASAEWDRTCRPPPSQPPLLPLVNATNPQSDLSNTVSTIIPDYCCMGASSGNGRIYFEKRGCNKGPETYRRLEELALQLYNESFLPLTAKNDDDDSERPPPPLCDACRMVDLLLNHNWTLAFLGDSVTGQSFFALECELRRRGLYHVERTTDWYQVNATHWRFSQYGLDAVHELRIRSLDDSTSNSVVAVIRFYAMYRPHIQHVLDHVVSNTRYHNDILIFDHGLHYMLRDMHKLEAEMTQLLQALLFESIVGEDDSDVSQWQKRRPWKLVAWRESSAQHFNMPGGEYHQRQRTCVPINSNYVNNTEDEKQGPRQRRAVMERVLASLNVSYNDVPILDFWNYSSHFYELHAPGDCTHYCGTPSFWLYLWHQVRVAMDTVL